MNEQIQKAADVLKENDRGNYTVPSPKLYPHQWLWDSCFIAIGLRHLDARRAAAEIESLFRGQWQNGMLPSIVMSASQNYWAGPDFWDSTTAPEAPNEIATSGITQPPLPAIAAFAVAKKLPSVEAEQFLKKVYPNIVRYHQWLYRERDPNNTGLVVLVHPWECGLDNSPPWIETIKWLSPAWIATFVRLRLGGVLEHRRKDTREVPVSERLTTVDALKFFHLAYLHRRNNYSSQQTLAKSRYCLQDVVFNSILIRANSALRAIAERISEDIPYDLDYRFEQSKKALEQLWDADSGEYYPRNFRTQKLVKEPSIATFLPLFSGDISLARAKILVELLKSQPWWPQYPVPTVPLNSKYFDSKRYWQGPTWINTNWMIIKGLEHYKFTEEAKLLRQSSLALISNSGMYEYFSPIDGAGYGINNFSWTAALYIDLLNSK